MARIRSIKPQYWTSEQVMGLSRDARLLFIGLWNFSDDGGNHPASAITLKAEVLPGDDVTASTVMQWVDELIEQQLVVEYEVDGKEFWHVTGWHHQRIDQPTLRHPTGDAGDTGDATGDAGDARHQKRLGGKQRQLLLKKLRDSKGDACHSCGDAPGVTLARVTYVSPAEANEYKGYGLVCSTCKRKIQSGDAQVTQGDARYVEGDSPLEWSGGEGNREEGSNTVGSVIVSGTPVTPQVTRVTSDDDFAPKDPAEWCRYWRERHGVELDPSNVHDRRKAWPLFAAWTTAGITAAQMDAAVRKAKAEAKDSIAFLPAYVDRVLASMQAPQPAPHRMTADEQRRAISDANGAAWLAQSQPSDPNVIDMET